MTAPRAPRLFAVSDLHVSYPENRAIVAALTPGSPDDWLLVAGDVAETLPDVGWALGLLAGRFARVVWVPGNHELWSVRSESGLRGEERYRRLVELCRGLGVVTPEDPYPVFDGDGGPAVVAPLFTLYDYSFRPDGAADTAQGLAIAYARDVVCTDEFLLHPDPYPDRAAWCRARVGWTERRLLACDPELPIVMVNHYPLVREPTRVLRYPEFAQWCGTDLTSDWHRRFRTACVVYGHLHIPRTTWYDGVRFEEVSLGYPREQAARRDPRPFPRQILPAPVVG